MLCDELSSVLWWIDLNLVGKLIRSAIIEPSPPLYFILLHSWIKLFGATELSIRFLSVLMGLFSITITYFIGKELINTRTGITAALIMAISPYHLYHSTYARMYALLLFLVLLSHYFFIKLLKAGHRKWLWWYILSTALGLYAHYSSLYAILVQNAYFLIFWKDHRKLIRLWIQAEVGVIFCFLPWLLIFLKDLLFSEWSLKTIMPIPLLDTIRNIKDILIDYFMPCIGQSYFNFSLEDFSNWRLLKWLIHTPFIIPTINFLMALTFTLFFISGLIYLFKNKKSLVFLCLYSFAFLVFLLFIPRYNRPRFFFQICPAFYLMLASGIINYKSRLKALSLGILILFHLLAVNAYYAQIKLSPVKSAFVYLKRAYQNGDVILINSYDIRNRGTNFWYHNKFQNNNAFTIRLLVLPAKRSSPGTGKDRIIPPTGYGQIQRHLKPLLEKIKKACNYQNVEDIYETIILDDLDKKKRIWYVGDERWTSIGKNSDIILLLENRAFTLTSYKDFDIIRLYFLEK